MTQGVFLRLICNHAKPQGVTVMLHHGCSVKQKASKEQQSCCIRSAGTPAHEMQRQLAHLRDVLRQPLHSRTAILSCQCKIHESISNKLTDLTRRQRIGTGS